MENNLKLKTNIVDLDGVKKNGNSKLLKSLPNFIIRKLKKIIHQEELNEIHNKYWDKIGFEYVEGLIREFRVKLTYFNLDAIPKEGRYIYIANHSQGALDAISYLYTIHKHQGDVVSPSNQIFEFIPNLSPFIIGVNVFGKNTKEKAKIVNEAFLSNRPIMIFPSGEVSRKNKNGTIEDPEWHKTFVTKAIESKRDIVPCYITGRNSERFYRISRWRKFFGIKTYIETVYLPDEMLKQCCSELKFNFGKPIPYTSLDKSLSHSEWALKIREIVYNMKIN